MQHFAVSGTGVNDDLKAQVFADEANSRRAIFISYAIDWIAVELMFWESYGSLKRWELVTTRVPGTKTVCWNTLSEPLEFPRFGCSCPAVLATVGKKRELSIANVRSLWTAGEALHVLWSRKYLLFERMFKEAETEVSQAGEEKIPAEFSRCSETCSQPESLLRAAKEESDGSGFRWSGVWCHCFEGERRRFFETATDRVEHWRKRKSTVPYV
jgi:hypothetical protein